MQVMLNVALAGIGEKFDLVEVDDAYGENLINGGDAVLYVEDDAAQAASIEQPTADGPGVVVDTPNGPVTLPPGFDPNQGIGAGPAPAQDGEGAEGDQDEPPPDPDAPKREQAAWADAHGVHYPKSASGERIAQAIADHLADQEEAAGAEPDDAEPEAVEDDAE